MKKNTRNKEAPKEVKSGRKNETGMGTEGNRIPHFVKKEDAGCQEAKSKQRDRFRKTRWGSKIIRRRRKKEVSF